MKTEPNQIRQELLTIAKERGIEVNKNWTTKFLANYVTNLIVALHQTKNQRAWESRRQKYGGRGTKGSYNPLVNASQF